MIPQGQQSWRLFLKDVVLLLACCGEPHGRLRTHTARSVLDGYERKAGDQHRLQNDDHASSMPLRE